MKNHIANLQQTHIPTSLKHATSKEENIVTIHAKPSENQRRRRRRRRASMFPLATGIQEHEHVAMTASSRRPKPHPDNTYQGTNTATTNSVYHFRRFP